MTTLCNPAIIKVHDSYVDHRFFRLTQDKEYYDVIPMYRSIDDVIAFMAHYVKSATYTGYAVCKGEDCPYCKAGFRLQKKLFIPFYNIREDTVQFWDRSLLFYPRIDDMFNHFPDVSEFVFRIIRYGEPGYVGTAYDIKAIARNTVMSYDDICKRFNIKFPDFYSTIIKDLDLTPVEEPTKLDTSKKLTPLTCARCGAPLDAEHKRCNFCGVSYIW